MKHTVGLGALDIGQLLSTVSNPSAAAGQVLTEAQQSAIQGAAQGIGIGLVLLAALSAAVFLMPAIWKKKA